MFIEVAPMQPWEAEGVQAVLWHEEVWPSISQDGQAKEDVTVEGLASNPNVTLLVGKFKNVIGAVGVLVAKGPGVYEIHTNILPEYRGKEGAACALKAISYIFTKTDATCLMTSCPKSNPPAAIFASTMGMQFGYTKPTSWLKGGVKVDQDVYYMRIEDWCFKFGKMFVANGERFHKGLGETVDHIDDTNHNAFVGLALEVGKHCPAKAAWLYNVIAPLYGYAPVRLLSTNEKFTVLDMGTAIVKVDRDINLQVLNLAE